VAYGTGINNVSSDGSGRDSAEFHVPTFVISPYRYQ
jgi:hypothetical protein